LVCPNPRQIVNILVYTHWKELRGRQWGTHGSSFLLLMTKVMVWHFVSNTHKVMTALICILHSKFCGVSLCNVIDMLFVGNVCQIMRSNNNTYGLQPMVGTCECFSCNTKFSNIVTRVIK
jgi:hypothetical protein